MLVGVELNIEETLLFGASYKHFEAIFFIQESSVQTGLIPEILKKLTDIFLVTGMFKPLCILTGWHKHSYQHYSKHQILTEDFLNVKLIKQKFHLPPGFN